MDITRTLASQVFERLGVNGVYPTTIEGLKLYASETDVPTMPIVLQPTICFVLQGQKRITSGQQSYVYNSGSYLINSVTRPVEASVFDVSESHPYLGLSLTVDQQTVGQLMMEMTQWQKDKPHPQQDVLTQSTPLTESITHILYRLLSTLNNAMDQQILSASICRELYYEVLKGPCGGLLRNSVINHAGANRIAPVVHYIEQHFEQDLDIQSIAGVAGMSASTLHEHFKQVTTVSPMQYVKSLRLHKARSMLSSGFKIAEVCYGVGYSSPSQFSREFKRFFGFTPSEAKNLTASME